MRAIILAGGLGMRLRPYTTILPKPLLPIGDRPILEHILRRLAACGVNEVDLSVGHLGELIQTYISQATTIPENLRMRWHREEEPLGTAGALKLIPGLTGNFFVLNGDVLTTLDYRTLLAFHESQEALLTIATRTQHVDIDLGVIETDGSRVTGYREKPKLHYDISMGIYVYDAQALKYLPDGFCPFPDLVLRLLNAGERVAAFVSDADWYDIGTFHEYERATQAIELEPDRFAT